MFAACAAPEAFLQREQWQNLKPVSGGVISNLTVPQRQEPVILSDAMSVPSLEKNEPPRRQGRQEKPNHNLPPRCMVKIQHRSQAEIGGDRNRDEHGLNFEFPLRWRGSVESILNMIFLAALASWLLMFQLNEPAGPRTTSPSRVPCIRRIRRKAPSPCSACVRRMRTPSRSPHIAR